MRSFWLLLALSTAAWAQQVVGSVQAQSVSVRGAVTVNGTSVELRSGAQLTTNEQPANIKLARGGTLRMCPRSSLQLTASPSGREMLIALDAGAIETDYSLTGGADSVMTADFQLQLTGPGSFHYAIGSDATRVCTHALAGSNSSVIVAETLGSGTYQVRPGDRASFTGASVANVTSPDTAPCGCPEAAVQTTPPELGFPEQQSQAAANAIATGEVPPVAPPIAGVPETTAQSDQAITQVSVPLAFKGAEEPSPPPAPITDAALAALPADAKPVVQPPPKPVKKNWLRRLFGKLFH